MKVSLKSLTAVCAVFCIVGCSSKDLYDEKAVEMKEDATYTDNFLKKYPNVDLNQDWDYTTGQVTYSLPSSSSGTRALTRGAYNVTPGEFILEGTVSDYMHTNMQAGKNNSGKGNPFYMKVPDNPFTVVPIFQGTASYVWELWMYVENVGHIKIWSKGDNLAYKKNEGADWTYIKPRENDPVPPSVYQVKSQSYTFTGLPKGENMYFYLKVWNSYGDFQKNTINPRKLTSLNQMMLALINCKVPSKVPAGNEVYIIGCEDNVNGDFDYEDLVFMMYGNPAPPIKHVDEVIVGTPKRYMMEDLGEEKPDFDFNDVVVDVISGRAKVKREYEILENGGWKLIKETTIENLPDIAVVRAAGGILDFTLKIGNTTWTKSAKFPNYKEMLNTGRDGEINYDKELDTFKVEGWNPDNNNISVTVEGNPNDIIFPKEGEAPKVISVDPTTNWMFERTPAPESWFKD